MSKFNKISELFASSPTVKFRLLFVLRNLDEIGDTWLCLHLSEIQSVLRSPSRRRGPKPKTIFSTAELNETNKTHWKHLLTLVCVCVCVCVFDGGVNMSSLQLCGSLEALDWSCSHDALWNVSWSVSGHTLSWNMDGKLPVRYEPDLMKSGQQGEDCLAQKTHPAKLLPV